MSFLVTNPTVGMIFIVVQLAVVIGAVVISVALNNKAAK